MNEETGRPGQFFAEHIGHRLVGHVVDPAAKLQLIHPFEPLPGRPVVAVLADTGPPRLQHLQGVSQVFLPQRPCLVLVFPEKGLDQVALLAVGAAAQLGQVLAAVEVVEVVPVLADIKAEAPQLFGLLAGGGLEHPVVVEQPVEQGLPGQAEGQHEKGRVAVPAEDHRGVVVEPGEGVVVGVAEQEEVGKGELGDAGVQLLAERVQGRPQFRVRWAGVGVGRQQSVQSLAVIHRRVRPADVGVGAAGGAGRFEVRGGHGCWSGPPAPVVSGTAGSGGGSGRATGSPGGGVKAGGGAGAGDGGMRSSMIGAAPPSLSRPGWTMRSGTVGGTGGCGGATAAGGSGATTTGDSGAGAVGRDGAAAAGAGSTGRGSSAGGVSAGSVSGAGGVGSTAASRSAISAASCFCICSSWHWRISTFCVAGSKVSWHVP